MEKPGNKTFDLNTHTARLLMKEPFFAALSRRINKVRTESIPTAGVMLNKDTNQFDLLYNPTFMAGLTDVEKLGVLKHEFYHLIFDHVTGRKPADPKVFKVWNYAADLAINSHLDGQLPENCLFPGRGQFENYRPGLAAEAYFEQLKQQIEENKKNGKGGQGQSSQGDGEGLGDGQFDSHDQWGPGEGVDENGKGQSAAGSNDAAKERLKDILRKAVQESQQAGGWGTVSSACQKEILAKLVSRIDWRKMLRYFIKTSQKADKCSTVRRINKRYAYIHPGKKVNRQAHVAICIDQSGSVDDSLLVLFFAELNKLADIATFTVIPFDHEIAESKIYTWKKGTNHKAERVLCGGTNFDAPTEYVNKHGFDGMVVLTDLEAPKPKAARCQRMWMTNAQHAAKPYFQTSERIVVIDK